MARTHTRATLGLHADGCAGPQGLLARSMPGYEPARCSSRWPTPRSSARSPDDSCSCARPGPAPARRSRTSCRRAVRPQGGDLDRHQGAAGQIVHHDVPLLERASAVRLERALMKGLSNYLCLRRYHEFRRSAAAPAPASARRLPLLERWARAPTAATERARAARGRRALGATCRAVTRYAHRRRVRSLRRCFVTACARAERAQLVIVNHHLFFADLALSAASSVASGAARSPTYDAVIFDEAH